MSIQMPPQDRIVYPPLITKPMQCRAARRVKLGGRWMESCGEVRRVGTAVLSGSLRADLGLHNS